MKKYKLNSGQSLFELLFALAVVALIIVGVASLATTSVRNSTFSGNNTLANKHAQDAIEWLRAQRDAGFDAFRGRAAASGTYCLNSIPPTWNIGACSSAELVDGIFRRQVAFTCFNGDAPLACSSLQVDVVQGRVTVSWTDANGTHSVDTSTRLSDWRR